MMYRPALNAAFLFAAIAVIVGAMGAHALRPHLSADMQVSLETAVKYQFYHSFALAFAGFLHYVFPSKWIKTLYASLDPFIYWFTSRLPVPSD
jgi:uncharacterized membrane protein YgdD (TMEM256/DUF423 family)